MTDLEILAELKMAYLNLEDIIENVDNTQSKSVQELFTALNILDKKYTEVYGKIEEENKKLLQYREDIMIAENIYNDYVTSSEDYDDQYITYADLDNEEKWWEDYNFLLK